MTANGFAAKTLRGITAAVLCAAVIACPGSRAQAAVPIVLQSGWNMVGISVRPLDNTPSHVFNQNNTFEAAPLPIPITNSLFRYTSGTNNYATYVPATADVSFGRCMLGDAYWLNLTSSAIWMYNGLPNGVPGPDGTKPDVWIPLNEVGSHMVGNPFTDTIPISNVQLTDGKQTVSWQTASTSPLNWVNGTAWTWQGSGYKAITAPSGNLEAFRGYWISTRVPNLAMIIPSLN